MLQANELAKFTQAVSQSQILGHRAAQVESSFTHVHICTGGGGYKNWKKQDLQTDFCSYLGDLYEINTVSAG